VGGSVAVGLLSARQYRKLHAQRSAGRAEDGPDLIVLKAILRDVGLCEPEERTRMLEDAKAGDLISQGDVLVQYAFLVEKWARRVWCACRGLFRQSFSLDDLRQEGRRGLLRAVAKYDPAHASGIELKALKKVSVAVEAARGRYEL
jgi:DNA-directed RNA polymerase sigma subunit (sigma70/sigma32)